MKNDWRSNKTKETITTMQPKWAHNAQHYTLHLPVVRWKRDFTIYYRLAVCRPDSRLTKVHISSNVHHIVVDRRMAIVKFKRFNKWRKTFRFQYMSSETQKANHLMKFTGEWLKTQMKWNEQQNHTEKEFVVRKERGEKKPAHTKRMELL